MSTWKKLVIIVVGSGLAAGLNFLASIAPTWVAVTGALSIACTATVGILTGWKTTA
jgi:hypothetical protein